MTGACSNLAGASSEEDELELEEALIFLATLSSFGKSIWKLGRSTCGVTSIGSIFTSSGSDEELEEAETDFCLSKEPLRLPSLSFTWVAVGNSMAYGKINTLINLTTLQ